ncbi:MAG: hypothetical protein M1503_04150 [Thaumarchaeota archaeon]|nr:hypothetical protein [Nitrososphaerota archaeon]MCL5317445.1 hypothetical protein [Nitrososphaerota archaeon]
MTSVPTALKIVLLLTVLLAAPLQAPALSPYTPNTLFLTVYGDGNTLVEYNLSVDPTTPRITVPLFCQIYSDMLITSNQSSPLDYRVVNGSIVIDTLGASGVNIIYTTPDLINKDGAVWTVSITSPISFSIRFPKEATIISMSSIPSSITTSDNQYIVTMKSGLQTASYSIGIVGTKEQAAITIKNAELAIEQARASAISLPEAENWLARAKSAYSQGQYSEAEQSAVQVIRLVEQAISKLKTTSTTTSSSANPTGTTQTTSASTPTSQSNDLLLLIPWLIAAAAVAVLLIILFRRRTGSTLAYKKEVRHVDAEALLRSRPQLRLEDREALQYLADSGGEAFETELREKFQLPKTTIWRQVRRLQREGLVEVRKIGGQNLIRIREDVGGH